MGVLSEDQVRSWTEASCAAQGVPVFVTDPEAVTDVVVLLGVVTDGPARRASAEEPSAAALA